MVVVIVGLSHLCQFDFVFSVGFGASLLSLSLSVCLSVCLLCLFSVVC